MPETPPTVTSARSLLFVPGDRPERFAKAEASGAGLVVLDLEDAVAPEHKEVARGHVRAWLAEGHRCAVRINAVGTPWHEEDVEAVSGHGCALMVPMADSAEELRDLAGRAGAELIALVETAVGVLEAPRIAGAEGVVRLALGTFDLAAELGVSPDDRDALAWSRGALVLASAAAGIAAPVDGVTGDVVDEERLRADVQYAVALGFAGKLCIHPRQVTVVEAELAPSEADVRWARSVLAGVEAAGGSAVVVVDGKMVDKPVVDRARRILGEPPPIS
jgi:citrate lyase subunit beta/citryl-CoA lyase